MPGHHGAWRCVRPADLGSAAVIDGGPWDLVVFSEGLPSQTPLSPLLRSVDAVTTPDATLLMDVTNGAHISALWRLVSGDLDDRAPGTAELSLCAPSLYKRLMDEGWMPNLIAAASTTLDSGPVDTALATLAQAADVPASTVMRTFARRRKLVTAQRLFGQPAQGRAPAAFCVVVPTHREDQLHKNVSCSPGLQEVRASVLACRDADGPGAALDAALQNSQVDAEWVLLCHQDVYFPSGFGHRLNELLQAIPEPERDKTLIGCAGIGVNEAADGHTPAGFVIDRLHRFDNPGSNRALSIDELAIVLPRRSVHRIDPSLGWHLWATDLCLSAICEHRVFPRIARLPLFHNSLNDYTLPASFYRSGLRLIEKYPDFGPIPTLCGLIDRTFCQSGLQKAR